ncbi:MAG: DUF2141 domain-containing protein [Anderseniella sp.]
MKTHKIITISSTRNVLYKIELAAILVWNQPVTVLFNMHIVSSLRSLRCIAVVACSVALATPAMAADVFVSVTGVRNASGTVLACLWTSGWGFPSCEKSGSNVRQIKVPAVQGTVSFLFENVPDGKYAISVGHDQNNDGVLERHRFLKYPIEGAGVSNYHTPPRFIPLHHEATFGVKGPAVTEISIPMHYPPDN